MFGRASATAVAFLPGTRKGCVAIAIAAIPEAIAQHDTSRSVPYALQERERPLESGLRRMCYPRICPGWSEVGECGLHVVRGREVLRRGGHQRLTDGTASGEQRLGRPEPWIAIVSKRRVLATARASSSIAIATAPRGDRGGHSRRAGWGRRLGHRSDLLAPLHVGASDPTADPRLGRAVAPVGV